MMSTMMMVMIIIMVMILIMMMIMIMAESGSKNKQALHRRKLGLKDTSQHGKQCSLRNVSHQGHTLVLGDVDPPITGGIEFDFFCT